MKVAIVDQTGDKIGGAQQSLETFLRFRPSDIEAAAIFFEDGAFASRVRQLGVESIIVPISHELSSLARERLRPSALLRLPRVLRMLRAAIRTIAPDVVYTNGLKAHVLGSIAARSLGIPCVVHHRDVLEGSVRGAFLAVIALCTSRRIATSSVVARCYPLPHTSIVSNPIDLDAFRDIPDRSTARAGLGLSGETPTAAVVGRINRWKGIDRFLRALASVNERTELHGLIVGAPHFRDADLLGELKDLCSELHLDERVRFVEWVDDPRPVFAAIDFNVNTSEREPFGRTIIEAAACGVPSVCFEDAGVAETMLDGSTGIVVPAGDIPKLAEALAFYAEDSLARRRAGAAARVWSERFDAIQHGVRIGQILRSA